MLLAVERNTYASIFNVLITRLNHFTLSHFGSNTFLATLKPNLATSAPRLDTGSLLEITRLGVSPNYILSTELAHPKN